MQHLGLIHSLFFVMEWNQGRWLPSQQQAVLAVLKVCQEVSLAATSAMMLSLLGMYVQWHFYFLRCVHFTVVKRGLNNIVCICVNIFFFWPSFRYFHLCMERGPNHMMGNVEIYNTPSVSATTFEWSSSFPRNMGSYRVQFFEMAVNPTAGQEQTAMLWWNWYFSTSGLSSYILLPPTLAIAGIKIQMYLYSSMTSQTCVYSVEGLFLLCTRWHDHGQ